MALKQIDDLIAVWSEELKEHYQERAAIREFEGGFDRDKAERLAYEEIRNRVDSDKVNK